MSANASAVARDYYDRDDVNDFYTAVWGGEDIHMGIYAHPGEPIAVAARRTVSTMAELVTDHLRPGRLVLDLGSGYGGPARYLAARHDCRVVALNISGVQNRRHRAINLAGGVGDSIDIVTASFEDIPFGARVFDLVWSQDALSHSDDQAGVLSEIRRVLKPGGRLIFTDLMAADGTSFETLRGALSRTGAQSLPTPGRYRAQLAELGFAGIEFTDYSQHLLTHYLSVTAQTHRRSGELADRVGSQYLEGLLTNLPLWVSACRDGYLSWGVFRCGIE